MASSSLTDEQAEALAARYLRAALETSTPRAEPVAFLIAAQPGAGKTAESARQKSNLPGGCVRVDADRLREHLPNYLATGQEVDPSTAASRTQADAAHLVRIVRAAAIAQRRNIVEEGTFRDAGNTQQLVEGLRRHGYAVELRVLAVSEAESLLGVYQRYEQQHADRVPNPRFVKDGYHNEVAANLPATVARVEDLTDCTVVMDRAGIVHYDSRQSQGRTAVDALAAQRRQVSPAMRAELAVGWDAVAQGMALRRAPPALQAQAQAHQARAHYVMHLDAQALSLYADGRSAEQLAGSAQHAQRHGQALAMALRASPQPGAKTDPDLLPAYAVLGVAHATAAKLPAEQRTTFVERMAARLAHDLASVQPIPAIRLREAREAALPLQSSREQNER